jgi:hypothetical protein
MAFIRTIKRENPFSQIDRYVFESDPSISWKAKGLMGYLLTRPDGWKINFKDLCNRAKDGREAVTSGLKELEKAGYIHYYQERTEKGLFGEWIYDVYERPEFNPLNERNPPLSENPISDNPLSEKTDYSNNKSNNNKLNNNKRPFGNMFTKKDIINTANEYYSNLAPGRWSKKLWNSLIERMANDLLNGEEYVTRVNDPISYIKRCVYNMAAMHDAKKGKINKIIDNLYNDDSNSYFDWLNAED